MFKSIVRSIAFVVLFQAISMAGATAQQTLEITWDDLIPPENNVHFVDYSTINNTIDLATLEDFDGDQESLDDYLGYMNEIKETQSGDGDTIAKDLDEKMVKIAGYVTPIEFDGENVIEFFLVPYHGACAHVPPPPSNQIIYVKNAEGLTTQNMYEPVYLVGKIDAKPVATMVANIGYTVEQGQVLKYDEIDYEPRRLIEITE